MYSDRSFSIRSKMFSCSRLTHTVPLAKNWKHYLIPAIQYITGLFHSCSSFILLIQIHRLLPATRYNWQRVRRRADKKTASSELCPIRVAEKQCLRKLFCEINWIRSIRKVQKQKKIIGKPLVFGCQPTSAMSSCHGRKWQMLIIIHVFLVTQNNKTSLIGKICLNDKSESCTNLSSQLYLWQP